MKFYIKNTDIYTNKKVAEANIVCLSDLHYTKNLTPQFLNDLANKIIELNPTYICFLGDLCDDESYNDVIEWLNLLSKIAPVYFIYGNHDIKKYRINDKNYYVSSHLPGSICNEIKNIDNLKVLSKNQIDTNNGYSFCGLKFYDDSNYNSFASYMNKHIPNFDYSNFNTLLSHNPKTIDPIFFKQLDEKYKYSTDCILSGHSHNGLVTPMIDKILPGNRGLYLKAKGIFPSYTRGEFDCGYSPDCQHADYVGVICPPLRTLPDRSPVLRKANDILYTPGIQLVRVKK
ncbi:MAG: metallophosphoesterase [Bacilli bacterium]|nr:metallophosphoesterase [Bacilli bacterium]